MFKDRKILNYIIIGIFWVFFLSGCATAPYVKPTLPKPTMPGIYHQVEKGQTLWRISKMYGVDIEELVRINHIPNSTNIEIGQKIFIPNRIKPQIPEIKYAEDDFVWPLNGRISSRFGQISHNMLNKGINIQPLGSLDVKASRSGRIVFLDEDFTGYGKTIIIDHGDNFFTVYTRNKQVFAKLGESVRQGTVIAKAGASGRDKNTYLHFEIRKGHIPQNPLFYLP
ncbi:MAG: M23 family metallopeptidase [Candidatus Omnitrophica bacterium]|nr:M23 family metallopeptidase [Candidatus Omnitrophota bacterium]